MKSETGENFITYHHNWFDHSDSRHPRIRTMSVHVYNNYYDGNAKYGVGVTYGGCAFVESNYFRNCPNPMMSSGQGTDAKGDGTFSGEDGGIIKAYGNYMTGQKSYITYQQDKTSFDAYEVKDPSEKVPSEVKAVKGGSSYTNFDTSADMYKYTPDDAKDVPSVVTSLAGRVNGGDFRFEFTADDDKAYSVNAALMDAIKSYQSDIKAIGSGFTEDNSQLPAVTSATVTTKAPDITTSAPVTTVNEALVTTVSSPAVTEVSVTTSSAPVQKLVYGDIDGSGEIDLSDLTLLSMYLLKDAELDAAALEAADVHNDGSVDVSDIALLKQFVMNDNVKLGK